MFVKGKKWGGGREKVDQIKNFYYLHSASVRSQKKSQTSWDFQRQIRGKIQDKFHSKTIVIEKKPILQKFFGQISLESNQFCAHFTNGNFANIFFWVLSCTTTETWTTCKCCLFKTGDFVFKTPACFAMSFGLGIVSHKGFFISDIIICSFDNELRDVPKSKLFISCTGQCPVFCNNNLRTLGSFGTFSH